MFLGLRNIAVCCFIEPYPIFTLPFFSEGASEVHWGAIGIS